MKKIPCSYSRCGERRIHHEKPDEPRGTQLVEVPDESTFGFCSITCALLGGYMRLQVDETNQCHKCFVADNGHAIKHGPKWVCDRPEVTEEQYAAALASYNERLAAFRAKYSS